ncbi:MAG: 2-oxoglutarate dehydrogenase E1 component [Oligoflexia bacterium]|nr:2-oxoglutarate dehydrogenase E1 component [Oligoflexia bacterium]MBF0364728.1 2-oxoglutarate dehydrogenase E1 component [Oligoflexia bacterium]
MSYTQLNELLVSNPQYLESLYDQYATNPNELSANWRDFFAYLDHRPMGGGPSVLTAPVVSTSSENENISLKEFQVLQLIYSYRSRGHYITKTNPIRPRKDRNPVLSLEEHGLSANDLDVEFRAGEFLNLGRTTLRAIIERLKKIYCQNIGLECMHMHRVEMRRWLRDKFENREINYSVEKKKRILLKLNEASIFENFLHTKFVGQKRFSLEGGENAIPALDAIIGMAAEFGTKEVVLGMTHRGRLNVLANVMGKTYEYIFKEFEGNIETTFGMGHGDVKYHLGYTSNYRTANGKEVTLRLLPNPSHLEAVGPVVLGFARGLGDLRYERKRSLVLPLLIHGDASLAGQGVVYESIQMARLLGCHVGGTIHFIINNQIGFTTDFDEARSSHYCTGIAKVIDVPVIHVNGDDAESVIYAVELATEFRQKFGEDIFIDMLCYRKHGHNEGDEPKYTQPELYDLIKSHPDPRSIYIKKLQEEGGTIDASIMTTMEKSYKELLNSRLNLMEENQIKYEPSKYDPDWEIFSRGDRIDFESRELAKTAISKEQFKFLSEHISTLPQGLTAIPKAQKIFEQRQEFLKGGKCDWAMGELLAYASLASEGANIRLSGQDSVRGTFSHRHASVYDVKNKNFYSLLDSFKGKKGFVNIYNSLLSEYAVLGYEYGYSLVDPQSLAIWEAQFGDFTNGAQIIIDQFISSAETKWKRGSAIVLLLPHGYEGQGPEHSSGRPERFLQLCAENNMIVANCTTPANLFHILRRQLHWRFRKPLVLFTPKSLLRLPACVSSIDDFVNGSFAHVIDHQMPPSQKISEIKKLVLCSGRVYYDLVPQVEKDTAIVRIEQLHPFPRNQVSKILERYRDVKRVMWVQEEPRNMGAYTYLVTHEESADLLSAVNMEYVGRATAASPATGYYRAHVSELEAIFKQVRDV